MEIILKEKDATITIEKDGEKHSKEVNPINLIDMLDSISATFETPLLPRHTRFFCQKGNEIALVLEIPHGKRQISGQKVHNSGERKVFDGVALPTAVFLFLCQQSAGSISIKQNRMFAVKQAGITSLDEPLYRFPTSDADQGGTVCWGNMNNVMSMKELWAVGEVPRRFFVSNFNELHWYSGDPVATAAIYDPNMFKYYEKLTQQDMFLDEWLIANRPQKTLREAMVNIFPHVLS